MLGSDTGLSAEATEKARALTLVVIAAHERGLANIAHVALACGDWAETHATITNRQGPRAASERGVPAARAGPAGVGCGRPARAG